jgi:hypothetical protein
MNAHAFILRRTREASQYLAIVLDGGGNTRLSIARVTHVTIDPNVDAI